MTDQPAANPSGIPYQDWQFWIATLVALIAAYAVLRMVVPASWFPGATKAQSKKVSLTVEGKKPDRK